MSMDNIQFRSTQHTGGVKGTDEITGLSTAEAGAKLSSVEGGLEKRKGELENGIRHEEGQLRNLKNQANFYRQRADRGGFCGRYYDRMADRLEGQVRAQEAKVGNMKRELGGVNKDLQTCNLVKQQIAADAAAQAETLKSAMASGDFESAFMLVMTGRLENLDAQVKGKIQGMQDRNEQILAKNNELAKLKGDPKKNASAIARLDGEINKLNSDSQLDMIKLQSLTNKRNQAHELLSNLINKLSGTMDKLIGNIR